MKDDRADHGHDRDQVHTDLAVAERFGDFDDQADRDDDGEGGPNPVGGARPAGEDRSDPGRERHDRDRQERPIDGPQDALEGRCLGGERRRGTHPAMMGAILPNRRPAGFEWYRLFTTG